MAKKKKHKQPIGAIIIVGSIVAVFGFMLFFNTDPERLRVASADMSFSVVGDVPSDIEITVSKDIAASERPWTAVVGDVYVISPDGVVLPTPVTIRASAIGRSIDRNYAIGYFDTVLNTWVPIETIRDDVRGVFEARTDHFSHWALLQLPEFTVLDSDKERLIETALSTVPAGANAYSVDLAYATVPGDFVMLETHVSSGECAGTSTVKEEEQITSVEKRATLLLDEIEFDGDIRAIVRWSVGSGCLGLISE